MGPEDSQPPSQAKRAFIVWSTLMDFCQQMTINKLLFG